MKRYKNYFIDGVIFKNESEIDNFILKDTIELYKRMCELFNARPSIEMIQIITPIEDKLHSLGLSYEEIEALEISTYN